MINNQESVIQN